MARQEIIDLTEIEDIEPEIKEQFERHDELCTCSDCMQENIGWYMGAVL